MKIPFFDLKRQNSELRAELHEAFDRVLDVSNLILGEEVKKFENDFAQFQQLKFFWGCANGTDALEIALKILDVRAGYEVIVPGFGWLSPTLAVKSHLAIPVFCDVLESDFGINPDHLTSKITSKTMGIIVEHLFGNPASISEIRQIADQYGLFLIEDCAQSQGVSVDGRSVGTWGDISTFSFYPTKNLGALGDAGGLGTNQAEFAEKIEAFRNYGRREAYLSSEGRNSRLDELQAAFLNAKLPIIMNWNERRRAIAKRYCDALNLPFLENSTYHQFVVKVENRKEFRQRLLDAGIETAEHYPFDQAELYDKHQKLPISQKLAKTLVSLPIFPELTEAEIIYICQHLEKLKDYIS